MNRLSLVDWLQEGARRLSLRMEFGKPISLPHANQLVPIARLIDFGDVNGMLIFGNFAAIRDSVDELRRLGYGYSVLEASGEVYEWNEDDFLEMLRDWGWSSNEANKPVWLV